MILLVALLCAMPVEPGRCDRIVIALETMADCKAARDWLHTSRRGTPLIAVDAACIIPKEKR